MVGTKSIEAKLVKIISNSILKAIDNGEFSLDKNNIPLIKIEIPRDEKFGDFSSNIAMLLTKQLKRNPNEIANIIVNNINDKELIEKTDIVSGFINFTLKNSWLYEEIKKVFVLKENYGKNEKINKSINIEYVSANPTGPPHIGNARGGAIGDVIANIFLAYGYDVYREFYLNDAGNQIAKFADSLNIRYLNELGKDLSMPEDGYMGEDIIDLVKKYISEENEVLINKCEEERKAKLVKFALKENTDSMISVLSKYKINYDKVFSEQSLYETGEVDEAIKLLKKTNSIYEKDGATWFKASEYGLEKDEVLIRNNGVPTYFLADIAYHFNKLKERKFDRCINVWGADHHGHVARLKKALLAGGIKEDRLDVILMQLVHLIKNNESVRMSKRKGGAFTLSDLLDEVGVDSARFMFNMNKPDTHMNFDIGLAIENSNENPVFYVQYAHARICSIIRNANREINLSSLDLLKEKEEIKLIKKIADFSSEIEKSVESLDPSKMTKYATSLASLFHTFYNNHKVILEDEALMDARLALIMATRYSLKNTLDILGVSAPEKM